MTVVGGEGQADRPVRGVAGVAGRGGAFQEPAARGERERPLWRDCDGGHVTPFRAVVSGLVVDSDDVASGVGEGELPAERPVGDDRDPCGGRAMTSDFTKSPRWAAGIHSRPPINA